MATLLAQSLPTQWLRRLELQLPLGSCGRVNFLHLNGNHASLQMLLPLALTYEGQLYAVRAI